MQTGVTNYLMGKWQGRSLPASNTLDKQVIAIGHTVLVTAIIGSGILLALVIYAMEFIISACLNLKNSRRPQFRGEYFAT